MKNLIETAELSMIMGFCQFMDVHKPKKLRFLLRMLGRIATKRMLKLPPLTDQEIEQVMERLIDFTGRAGWLNKKAHACQYLAFLAALIERHDWPEIEKAIIELQDFFDGRDESGIDDMDYGIRAFDIWRRVWK